MADLECRKICCFCSAWDGFDLPDSKNFGYCSRYDLKTQAYEWCETWDEKRALRPRRGRDHELESKAKSASDLCF